MTNHPTIYRLFCLSIAVLSLAACSSGADTPTPDSALPADQAAPTSDTAAQTDPAQSEPSSFWIEPGTPFALADAARQSLTQAGYTEASSVDQAALTITRETGPSAALSATWFYAVAAPFPTIPDDISSAALQSYWTTADPSGLSGFVAPPPLVLSAATFDWLTAVWGAPADTLTLKLYESGSPANLVWEQRPSLAILPFDALTPDLKVLSIDGQTPLDKFMQPDAYPLRQQVGVTATNGTGQQALAALQQSGLWLSTNRAPARLSSVVLTGVTALVRATASQMQISGTGFPVEQITPFFADADILHTSNEVSFTPQCPLPEWTGPPQDFCSLPAHFELLQIMGLDIVELTGNHNNDVGTGAFNYSLDLYDQTGIVYYGGGRDLDDSRMARILTTGDGTRVAFVGCNSAGPFLAWATAASAGATPCEDWSFIRSQITELKSTGQADIVIVTLQHREVPSAEASSDQVADFSALSEAGADIVSGSQAHQPQGFAFDEGRFIHYGVGNLFFDQPELVNRQMFADKHILYEGRHISTVLFTGVIEDWSQPRPMTPEERTQFLQTIFTASGW